MMNMAAILELLGLVARLLGRSQDDPETKQALAIVAGLEAAVRAGDDTATATALGQLRTHVRANVIAADAAIDAELERRFHEDETKG